MFDETVLKNYFPFLEKELALHFLPLNWKQCVMLLYDRIAAENRTMNLTSITMFEEFMVKHILDSLLIKAILPTVSKEEYHIADVGCGAGFPGLPLAITFPHLHLTEIDSAQKKIAFLHHLIPDLSLEERCQAISGRTRELSKKPRWKGNFDIVLARAVSSTGSLIVECRQLLRPETGILCVYKTPATVKAEYHIAVREAKKHHLCVGVSPIYSLPESRGKRQFFIIGNSLSPLFSEIIPKLSCKHPLVGTPLVGTPLVGAIFRSNASRTGKRFSGELRIT